MQGPSGGGSDKWARRPQSSYSDELRCHRHHMTRWSRILGSRAALGSAGSGPRQSASTPVPVSPSVSSKQASFGGVRFRSMCCCRPLCSGPTCPPPSPCRCYHRADPVAHVCRARAATFPLSPSSRAHGRIEPMLGPTLLDFGPPWHELGGLLPSLAKFGDAAQLSSSLAIARTTLANCRPKFAKIGKALSTSI